MNNNKHLGVFVVIILALIVFIGGFWFLLKKGVVKPTDNALNDLKKEEYTPSPASGYGVVALTSKDLGKYLAGPNKMTLYITTLDECVGKCLELWQPYIVAAPSDATGGSLGTSKRGNAYQQTYNGEPLYYFKGDQKERDILGHAWNNAWFVARP